MTVTATTKDILRQFLGDRITAYLHGMRFARTAERTVREDREIWAAMKLVQAGTTVIDVGANGADWTLALARAVGSGGRVLAFEAHPYYARATRNAIARLGLTSVDFYDCALGDAEGSAQLLVKEAGKASLSGRARLISRKETGPGVISVRIRCLDDILADADSSVSLIKADTEGFELAVFRGAARTIDRFRPIVVTEVGHGWMHNMPDEELDRFFMSRDYLAFVLDPKTNAFREISRPCQQSADLSENRFLVPMERRAILA